MNKISDITRQDIIDIIKNGFVVELDSPIFDGKTFQYVTTKTEYMPYCGRLDEIDFLTRIYDLQSLPSYDHRYRDALGDITCHLRWGDFEDCWFFKDRRFKLMQSDGDEPLLRFITEMLHPAVRDENSPWKAYLDKFNELLRADGYELYPAEHISGRDIYKARLYALNEAPQLPRDLFSERYKKMIRFHDGNFYDSICGDISIDSKVLLSKTMYEFAEPIRIQPNRYDNWTYNTDALNQAIHRLHDFCEVPKPEDNAYDMLYSQDEVVAHNYPPYLFDIIELQFDELSSHEKPEFQIAINKIFEHCRIPFRLTDRGLVEPYEKEEVLTSAIVEDIEHISEPGLHDLLFEAIELHKHPSIQSHRDSVEKMWDALERLKTYYTDCDKKTSVGKIVDDMASGEDAFKKVFNDEFQTLTNIGNNFRIRHHETNKTDINDIRHYDYLFNRCLSLISLAIKYLE